MTSLSACSISTIEFHGWDARQLDNGLIRLVAVPDIGGRIMAYDLGSYPFVYIERPLAGKLFSAEENQGDGSLAAWKNYGGDKTWPSPQGWDNDQQWHGPPDPVLDTGRYTVAEFTCDGDQAVISMVSPPDARTGVQITRRFTIRQGSTAVKLDITFKNIKDTPIRWSIWDVMQLRAEQVAPDGSLSLEPSCVVTAPLNPASKFPRGFNVMFGAEDNPQWQADPTAGLFSAPYMWEIGKVGLDSTVGWIAFSNPAAGFAFVERFTHEPGGDYPDEGVTVEVWTTGAGEVGNLDFTGKDIYHMETEVLSPFRDIAPGETAYFAIEWGACRSNGPVVAVNPGGALTQALTLTPQTGDVVRLTCQGSVFAAGDLLLRWRQDDHTIEESALGPVDPLTLIQLDQPVKPPAGAQAVQLVVRAAADEVDRLLAEATL
jgi:hypothetical protein